MTDRDSEPWWEALARHELLLQSCAGCGTRRWPPRAICNRCGSLEWAWVPAAGTATVASWIVDHHDFGAGITPPYVVVLARLDDQDDILIPGGWAGSPLGDDLTLGARLRVTFDRGLIRWAP